VTDGAIVFGPMLAVVLALLTIFGAAVTSARRIGVAKDLAWVALAIASGVVPVLTLVLATGVVSSGARPRWRSAAPPRGRR